MIPPIIDICRIVRRNRGGSQSFLVEAGDGMMYVAKFADNPQGTRTLANEWVGYQVLQHFGIKTPRATILRLDEAVCRTADEFHFRLGNNTRPITPGYHFGSQVPVDLNKVAIYDFLPRTMARTIGNLSDFARMLVVDVLLRNHDTRQVVFAREKRSGRLSFQAYFIDHGMIFGGSQWSVEAWPGGGLYFDKHIYSHVDLRGACESILRDIDNLREDDCHRFMRGIPSCWLRDADGDLLWQLLSQVYEQRTDVRRLVSLRLAPITEAIKHFV